MGKGISLEELNRRGRLEKVAPKLRHSPQPVAWNSMRELGEHLRRFEREHFRPREQKQDLQPKPSEGILQQVFWVSIFFFLMKLPLKIISRTRLISQFTKSKPDSISTALIYFSPQQNNMNGHQIKICLITRKDMIKTNI